MAAPRAVQFIALRNLQRGATRQQSRSLHMTGPATYASPFLSSDRGNPNVSRDQTLRPSKSSKATSRKISSPANSESRTFNTSRTLKAVNDSSTMDFAYFPDILAPEDVAIAPMQVPILPETQSTVAMNRVEEAVVMQPEIQSVSADSIILPLSDHTTPSDEYMHINFRGMADKVAENVNAMKLPVEEQAGLMKRIWSDMVDDVVGKKTVAA